MTKSINNRNNGSVEAMFRGLCERATTAARAAAPQQFVSIQAFRGTQDNMLSFQVGDTISASRNQKHMDWWFGYCKGEVGWFPTHCVQTKYAVSPNNNKQPSTASSMEQQQQQLDKSKFSERFKQAIREGAQTARLAMVCEDTGRLDPQHSAHLTNNNAVEIAAPRRQKTTLQLALEQDLAVEAKMLSPTQQVLLYKVQTPLPASLQLRREQLWMSEQHDQQTVSSSSTSSSYYSSRSQSSNGRAGSISRDRIRLTASALTPTKIVGMEVFY